MTRPTVARIDLDAVARNTAAKGRRFQRIVQRATEDRAADLGTAGVVEDRNSARADMLK